MSIYVLLENLTLVLLTAGVLLSYLTKVELKRNFLILVIFYVGLLAQYYLKENGLGKYWFLSFGFLAFVGVLGVAVTKFKSLTKTDCILVLLFLFGVIRNYYMHFDRYIIKQNAFVDFYRVSGTVADTLTVLLIVFPLIGETSKYYKTWKENGNLGLSFIKYIFGRFHSNSDPRNN